MSDKEYYIKYMMGRDFLDVVQLTAKFGKITNNVTATIIWVKNDLAQESKYEISVCIRLVKEGKWKIQYTREDKLKRILGNDR